MRRGTTTIELLIGLGIGTLLIGCLMAVWNLGVKMRNASDATMAVQSALGITESLFCDLRQMGLEPGAPPYLLRGTAPNPPSSLSFFRVGFRPDRMDLIPVRYYTVPSPGGNVYLARDERRGGKVETKVFRACALFGVSFTGMTDSWGNNYLTVNLAVLETDRDIFPASANQPRHVFQKITVRVPVPDRLGDPALSKVVVVQKDGELLPP